MTQPTIPPNDATISSYVAATPSTGPFQVDFPFVSLNDVIVTLQADGSSIVRTLVRGADYTLAATANEDGTYTIGTVTLMAAVSNTTVTRTRDTTIERLSNFPLTGYFSRLSLNAELNKLTMIDQEFDRHLGLIDQMAASLKAHALRIPDSESGYNTVAAIAATRAGKLLAWDGSGNLIQSNKSLGEIENPTVVIVSGTGYVANLTALKALPANQQPPTIEMLGYETAGDGGGGQWSKLSGSSLVANDVTVVTCAATPSDRYVRNFNGVVNARMGGAKLDGTTDDTVAWQRLLAVGGELVFDGVSVIGTVTGTVPGTHLRGLGRARFVSKAASTGYGLLINADDCTVENIDFESLASPAQTSQMNIAGHRYRVKNCNFYGMPWDPLQMNVPTGPQASLRIGSPGGYAAYDDGVIEDVYVTGGQNGVVMNGGRRCRWLNVTSYYTLGFGGVAGAGLTAYDFQCVNFLAIGCGQYGFSNAQLFGGAASIETVPMYGWNMLGMHAENTGYQPYFTGINAGGVGASKFGFDITDQAMNGGYFQGTARNCLAGGLECKGGGDAVWSHSVTANVPAGSTVIPIFTASNWYPGMRIRDRVSNTTIPVDTTIVSIAGLNVTISKPTIGLITGVPGGGGTVLDADINPQPPGHCNLMFDFVYTCCLDAKGTTGLGHYQEDAANPTGSWVFNNKFRLHSITEAAPPWRTGSKERVFNPRASAGFLWICLGSGTNPDGVTGTIAPTGGTATVPLTNASGATASGTLIAVASSTNFLTGMNIFAIGIPDGATIAGVPDATHITLSAPLLAAGLASGASVMAMKVVSDGALRWGCMGTDTSAAPVNNTGFGSYGVKNVDLEINSINCAAGVILAGYSGVNTDYINASVRGNIIGSKNGVQLQANGSLNNIRLNDMYIEASSVGVTINGATSATIRINGGHIHNIGSASRQGVRISSGANNVIYLGGGVHIDGQSGLYIDGGTNLIWCGDVLFEAQGGASGGGAPVRLTSGSAGIIDFGNARVLNNNAGAPAGYDATGSAMTVRGKLLRQDKVGAGATDPGQKGEYTLNPTATQWGQVCVATNTWKTIALV